MMTHGSSIIYFLLQFAVGMYIAYIVKNAATTSMEESILHSGKIWETLKEKKKRLPKLVCN